MTDTTLRTLVQALANDAARITREMQTSRRLGLSDITASWADRLIRCYDAAAALDEMHESRWIVAHVADMVARARDA